MYEKKLLFKRHHRLGRCAFEVLENLLGVLAVIDAPNLMVSRLIQGWLRIFSLGFRLLRVGTICFEV